MPEKLIFYRDHEMTADWPDKIRAAQLQTHYRFDSELFERIPYGREWGRGRQTVTCHDCGVIPGELHVPSCDMERCPRCRGQRLSCSCGDD